MNDLVRKLLYLVLQRNFEWKYLQILFLIQLSVNERL